MNPSPWQHELPYLVYYSSFTPWVQKLTLQCLCYIRYYSIQHPSQYLIPHCDICNFIGLSSDSWSKSNQMWMKFHLWPSKQPCIFCFELQSSDSAIYSVWMTGRVISTDLNGLHNFFFSITSYTYNTSFSKEDSHLHVQELELLYRKSAWRPLAVLLFF